MAFAAMMDIGAASHSLVTFLVRLVCVGEHCMKEELASLQDCLGSTQESGENPEGHAGERKEEFLRVGRCFTFLEYIWLIVVASWILSPFGRSN